MTGSSEDQNLLYRQVTVQDKEAKALLDPGSTHNIISLQLVQQMGKEKEIKRKVQLLKFINNSNCKCVGDVVLNVKVQDREYQGSFKVVEITDEQLLLGMPWFINTNPKINWRDKSISFVVEEAEFWISKDDLKEAQKMPDTETFMIKVNRIVTISNKDSQFQQAIHQLKDEFKDIFSEMPPGVPQRDVKHLIPLDDDQVPKARPYRLSLKELEELKAQLTKLQEKGWIRPSSSQYSSPVLFVVKKDGKLRMCIDYRGLNSKTIKDQYSIPRIDECFDQLGKGKVFSKLDLASGYYQIPIADGDIHKTAFTTRYGNFEWLVMPFGLTSAPATFQRLMNTIFLELLDVCLVVYLDDILVYSETPEKHIEHLKQVFEILRRERLYAQEKKCEFGLDNLEYLGHIVGAQGLKIDQTKVKIVVDWPQPKDVKQLRSFLGLANYYRKFIQGYSVIAAPLTRLCGSVPFEWSEECEKTFKILKQRLTEAPVLAFPDLKREFVVFFDASSVIGVGGVLCQEGDDGKLHPLAFESRKLLDAEKHYPVHELELLAFVHCLKKWRHYLDFRKFKVFTDNRSLETIWTNRTPSLRIIRWLEYIQTFQFDIVHLKRELNHVADILSKAEHAGSTIKINRIKTHPLSENLLAEISKSYKTDFYWKDIFTKLNDHKFTSDETVRYELREGLLYICGIASVDYAFPNEKKFSVRSSNCFMIFLQQDILKWKRRIVVSVRYSFGQT